MVTKVKEETYEITQLETGIVGTDIEPGDDLDEWDEIWRLQVKTGLSFVLTPEDAFSLYAAKLSDAVDYCLCDDGGVIVNDTTDANDAGANDVNLLPAVPAVNDALYIGYRHPFSLARINIGTAGAGTWTVTWEYYNGISWAALPGISDGTTGFKAGTGNKDVTWTVPNDWAKTTVDGLNAYWARGRVSAYTSVTTQPLGTQMWINSGEAVRGTDLFKIELRDDSEGSTKKLLGPITYTQITEFQDQTKKAHLDLAKPVVALEGMWLAILAKATAGVLDASESYFSLECKRVRHTMFGGA